LRNPGLKEIAVICFLLLFADNNNINNNNNNLGIADSKEPVF